ncbi:MAG: hypothetical protein J1G38_06395 [Clostridiales bacterium]|nr:hypothetical protein [Clostridiales bacterium]
MQYHIQTAPIWEAYSGDGCPLCRIYENKEKRLVKSYLNENVMDPHFRERSNSVGFCAEHVKMLYAGENKLGLALQLETRAAYLSDLVKNPPNDKKSAKRLAEKLTAHDGCVICNELDEFMPRYYMTVAQMFAAEPEFPHLFTSASHCYKHAVELLRAAEYAGKSLGAFAAEVLRALNADTERTAKELRAFADCFDHNSTAKPDKEAIPRAVLRLLGKKL